ncbi:MAG: hypothetical protein GY790_22555 [Bacteroidetes bacterium]|nr:hypothetical protein [Bacteroidota bacterium]
MAHRKCISNGNILLFGIFKPLDFSEKLKEEILEDYVHTYAKGNVTDHMEPVVDNFAPYVEKVIVTTAEGDSVYEAGWEISGDRTT